MKRIAIFCDGTWSNLSGAQRTHVAQLARAVMPLASDGVEQFVYYQPGLGTGRGRNPLTRMIDKWVGGAFGLGLNANLADAYRQLCFWYEPGDEVYLFGYSRGAYLARSLTGLIRLVGIAPELTAKSLREAIAEYRQRDLQGGADCLRHLTFRKSFSPRVATSPKDLDWRRQQGDDESFFLRLRYLGVWDTVGSLGIPGVLGWLSHLVNERNCFHDQRLAHMVYSARHAVAIDERRRHYPPTLWSNLERLNGDAALSERRYRQEWFPGNHSIIGGNGSVPELSACAARWVIDGARKLDLHFDRTFLDCLRATARADIPMPQGFDPGGLTYQIAGRWLLADRDQLRDPENISRTALDRMRLCSGYRPATLTRVLNRAEP